MMFSIGRALVLVLVVLSVVACATVTTDTGTMATVGSYSGQEGGRHWVRPREITYEFGDIVDFSTTIDFDEAAIGYTRVFGHNTGELDDPYVRHAAARFVERERADGIYITTFTVTEDPEAGTVTVRIQGRPLILNDLGIVEQDRADMERFMFVEEVDPETGKTKTYTVPVQPGPSSSVTGATTVRRQAPRSGSGRSMLDLNAGVYLYEWGDPLPGGNLGYSYHFGERFALGIFGGFPDAGVQTTLGSTDSFAFGVRAGVRYYRSVNALIGCRFYLRNIALGMDYGFGNWGSGPTFTAGYAFRF